MIKNLIKKILEKFSYEIKKIKKNNILLFNSKETNNFEEYYQICRKESLNVSKERFVSLYQSINYIYKNDIKGDFVECGVFMGGSAMMISFASKEFEKIDIPIKNLWLYDTFEGMANPTIYDQNILNEKAINELKNKKKKENLKDIWAYSSIDYVKQNIPSATSHKLYFDYGTQTLDQYYLKYASIVDSIYLNNGYTNKNFKNLKFKGADHSENSWQKRIDIPFKFLLKQN